VLPNTDYIVGSDKSLIHLEAVEAMLSRSYWAASRSRETIRISIKNSMCFGVYDGQKQIAFARVITDYAVFAYLCDVIIDEDYRGKGIGKRLMEYIMGCGELKEVRSWTLKTKDAHGLYRQYGFEKPGDPELYMQRIVK
jgi:GNAT superfamily N-acetyltransferase